MKNAPRSFKLSHKVPFVLLSLLIALSVFTPSSAQKGARDNVGRLKAGNARYVSGKLRPRDYKADRKATADGQHPYAIVLACADSRVPPEILFDESLGKLFVVRVAGNVVDPVALGSIEYAAEHLHVETLLVLGHESCGAVKATLDGGEAPPHIDALVKRIEPAVEEAKKAGLGPKETLALAVKLNVSLQIDESLKQSKVLTELVHEHKLQIVGGVYNLRSGRVEFLRPRVSP